MQIQVRATQAKSSSLYVLEARVPAPRRRVLGLLPLLLECVDVRLALALRANVHRPEHDGGSEHADAGARAPRRAPVGVCARAAAAGEVGFGEERLVVVRLVHLGARVEGAEERVDIDWGTKRGGQYGGVV